MKKKEEILQQLKNYIDFENSETLSWLHGLADDAFFHKTDGGYVGSILIYHQLTENLLVNLIEKSNLLIQTFIHPKQYPDIPQKEEGEKVFSYWLSKLKQHTIEFPEKGQIVQLSATINKIRNDFAHRISISDNIYNVEIQAQNCKNNFELLFKKWVKASKFFYNSFDDLYNEMK